MASLSAGRNVERISVPSSASAAKTLFPFDELDPPLLSGYSRGKKEEKFRSRKGMEADHAARTLLNTKVRMIFSETR